MMKTTIDLAIEVLNHILPEYSQGDLRYLEKKLRYDRGRMKKIMRQVCADEVLDIIPAYETPTGEDAVNQNEVYEKLTNPGY